MLSRRELRVIPHSEPWFRGVEARRGQRQGHVEASGEASVEASVEASIKATQLTLGLTASRRRGVEASRRG